MQIHLEQSNRHTIQSYTETAVIVDHVTYEQSLIVSQNEILNAWDVKSLLDLNTITLQPILDLKPDFIIIGHSKPSLHLHPKIMQDVINRRIGIECMTIGAACRTFNVLLNEGRAVVLGLIFNEDQSE
ncbi:MAG: Mth938-like domain-containing protein [Legionellaceae bacterium]